MDKRKRGLEFSFAWLFAIIVGAFILFLAIYFISKFIQTEQTVIYVKAGKDIGILLNPLEIGFETAKSVYFEMPVETRIYNSCSNEDVFGRQLIRVSQKNLNKWSDTNIDVGFSNKYIFSDRYSEGKRFYVFSKPFEFPFKVSDLIYLTSSNRKYCFVQAPEKIKDEITSISQPNLLVENCSEQDIRVCFRGNCDIEVNYNLGYVERGTERVYFEGDALMYAAIFSDPNLYECHLKRLMKREKELAFLYNDKASFIARTGCTSNLNLAELGSLANNFQNSNDLFLISQVADDIENKNEATDCKLW